MTVWSQHIEKQISYAWNDWDVTERESQRVIIALLADPKIDATINDLDSTGALIKLYDRMANPSLLRQVVAIIASRSTTAGSIARLRLVELAQVDPVLTSSSHWLNFSAGTFFDICRDLGINSLAYGFASRTFAPLSPAAAPADPSKPFSGAGATGDNPTALSIGLGQAVVSTAIRNDLFSDLLTLGVRKGLTHNGIASLLASD
jgi:hypothetical protein